MQDTQPMGHTRYKKVRLGTSGNITYTQKNRKAHIKTVGLGLAEKDNSPENLER